MLFYILIPIYCVIYYSSYLLLIDQMIIADDKNKTPSLIKINDYITVNKVVSQ